MRNQESEVMQSNAQQEWKWCLVGNIVQERELFFYKLSIKGL